MNNMVRNSSLLSLVLLGTIALSGCSSTITREDAKTMYQSYDYRFNAGMTEMYELERTIHERDGSIFYELIDTDQTYMDTYVYYRCETTDQSGEKTSFEILAYEMEDNKGYSAYKDADGTKESSVTSTESKTIMTEYMNKVFDFACSDYTYLFEELDGTEATYYKKSFDKYSVSLKSDIDGVAREAEYHFTAQSSLEREVETITYTDGTSYSSVTNVVFNAPYTRKTSL